MAYRPENYGLIILRNDYSLAEAFTKLMMARSREQAVYSARPLLQAQAGDLEYWVETHPGVGGEDVTDRVNTHNSGDCLWEVHPLGLEIPRSGGGTSRSVFFCNAQTGRGMVPVDVISADVLPSLMEGDTVKLQVVGLPLVIEYYPDEETCMAAQRASGADLRLRLRMGELRPLPFLRNRSGRMTERDREVLFLARVTALYNGVLNLSGEKEYTFLRCVVETDMGRLELCHTYDQMPEELKKNIRVGAVVTGSCILSGDAAIYEYHEGPIRDFEHNLRLVRAVLAGDNPDRMKRVLAENAVYETDSYNTRFDGPEAIIERFHYVLNHRANRYITRLATLRESSTGQEYPPFARCITLTDEAVGEVESLCFVDVNEDGLITRIKISTDEGYRFRPDGLSCAEE